MRGPEQVLHRQVAEFLTYGLGGTAWWTTFPAGGGGVERGRVLQSIGLKPGVPDILVIDGGRALWLELKAPKGKLSMFQVVCHQNLHHARSSVAVCRSLDEVIAFLTEQGVPMRARAA